MYDLTKDEVLVCAVEAFSKHFRISNIDTTVETSIRITIGDLRLRIAISGMVEEVGDGVLMSSTRAKLAELVLLPFLQRASSLKLAA